MASREGKTEKATGKRKAEARSRGQVARSIDLNSTVGLAAVMAVLIIGGSKVLDTLEGMMASSLSQVGNTENVSTEGIGNVITASLKSFGLALAPMLLAAGLAGLASNIAQVKLKWSPQALKPRFSFLNPANGLKRIFGTNGLVELIKALVKLSTIGGIAFLAVWSQLPSLAALVGVSPGELLSQICSRVETIALEVLGVLVVLSALDVTWQRHRLSKSLMMSKEEVKQEARQSDVAPEVRGAIRRRQIQLIRRRMLADVPTADVVIVNPTHFAIALRYDGSSPAPQVVAKGREHIAAKIRELAEENGVPIVSNPPLARTLYREVELGAMIPEALYVAVAEVLAYVYRTARGRARARTRRTAAALA